jgi:hypothetical protein
MDAEQEILLLKRRLDAVYLVLCGVSLALKNASPDAGLMLRTYLSELGASGAGSAFDAARPSHSDIAIPDAQQVLEDLISLVEGRES